MQITTSVAVHTLGWVASSSRVTHCSSRDQVFLRILHKNFEGKGLLALRRPLQSHRSGDRIGFIRKFRTEAVISVRGLADRRPHSPYS